MLLLCKWALEQNRFINLSSNIPTIFLVRNENWKAISSWSGWTNSLNKVCYRMPKYMPRLRVCSKYWGMFCLSLYIFLQYILNSPELLKLPGYFGTLEGIFLQCKWLFKFVLIPCKILFIAEFRPFMKLIYIMLTPWPIILLQH